jgi:hypothetical protein
MGRRLLDPSDQHDLVELEMRFVALSKEFSELTQETWQKLVQFLTTTLARWKPAVQRYASQKDYGLVEPAPDFYDLKVDHLGIHSFQDWQVHSCSSAVNTSVNSFASSYFLYL